MPPSRHVPMLTRALTVFLFLLFASLPAWGDQYVEGQGDPNGSQECLNWLDLYKDTSGGTLYVCRKAGTITSSIWEPISGGSGHGDGANCAAGEIPRGVDSSGAVQGCYEPSTADVTYTATTAGDWTSWIQAAAPTTAGEALDALANWVQENGIYDAWVHALKNPGTTTSGVAEALAACNAGGGGRVRVRPGTDYDLGANGVTIGPKCFLVGHGPNTSRLFFLQNSGAGFASISLKTDSQGQAGGFGDIQIGHYCTPEPCVPGDANTQAFKVDDAATANNPGTESGGAGPPDNNRSTDHYIWNAWFDGDGLPGVAFNSTGSGAGDCWNGASTTCAGTGLALVDTLRVTWDRVQIEDFQYNVAVPSGSDVTTQTFVGGEIRHGKKGVYIADNQAAGISLNFFGTTIEGNSEHGIFCDTNTPGNSHRLTLIAAHLEQTVASALNVELDNCSLTSTGSTITGGATNYIKLNSGSQGVRLFGDYWTNAAGDEIVNNAANAVVIIHGAKHLTSPNSITASGTNADDVVFGGNIWRNTDCSVVPTGAVTGDLCIDSDAAPSTLWWYNGTVMTQFPSGGAPGADSIGTAELDDGVDVPGSGDYLRVDTVDQAGIEYRTPAEARADLGADNASNLTSGTIPAARVGAGHIDGLNEFDGGLCTDGQIFKNSGGTSWVCAPDATGTGTPAGANTQVQYNNAGAFGAEAQFTYDPATNTLSVGDASNKGTVQVFCNPGVDACESDWDEDTGFSGSPSAGDRRFQARSDGLWERDSGGTERRYSTDADKRTECRVFEDLTAADDNYEIWIPSRAVTITATGIHCRGTCTTPATLTWKDRSGTAMTGGGTASTGTSNTTFGAITAGGGLVGGEGLAFDVTNTPDPATDEYTICWEYTF